MGTQNVNRIKVALAEAGITGKELAEKMGKAPHSISAWCTNSLQPKAKDFPRISKIIGCRMDQLIVAEHGD